MPLVLTLPAPSPAAPPLPPAPEALPAARQRVRWQRRGRNRPWPRLWSERSRLLERQHSRIEALLEQLIDGEASTACCRQLVRALGLHLRLEERWLAEVGCLCPGHRYSHREAAELAGCTPAGSAERLGWLLDLQEWFHLHRHGADAVAYARAAAAPVPLSSASR
ncbi:hypothetical protein [Synechococcus sp. CS-1333]|uniref:hypothetical protein n=1 Tax=Synechococcus sp. CS-1333 TaxID=2848638 RepID=UPI00223A7AFF|nr:hypothetical protein [Synechococcus sp. CS-1333]